MFNVDLHIQGGDETKADSFSGPVVLVFEASHHSLPHILKRGTRNTHLGFRIKSRTFICNRFIITSFKKDVKKESKKNYLVCATFWGKSTRDTARSVVHLWVGSLVHDLQQEGLVLVSNLVLRVTKTINEARQH